MAPCRYGPGIVLTLGLGDITNDNMSIQWQTAAVGIKLLDGVMPFVLSQGNHDVGKIEDGETKVLVRNDSLMNEYFPIASQPWISGTFEAGRVENSYSLFTFQEQKYLILALEYAPRDEVLSYYDHS